MICEPFQVVFSPESAEEINMQRDIEKNMRLTTAILTIVFLTLVVIYQLTSNHRDLAADLTTVFTQYQK